MVLGFRVEGGPPHHLLAVARATSASSAPISARSAPAARGLHSVHFSDQRKRFLLDRRCIRGCSEGVYGVSGVSMGCSGCILCQKRLRLS